jgi:hypothetical protein
MSELGVDEDEWRKGNSGKKLREYLWEREGEGTGVHSFDV